MDHQAMHCLHAVLALKFDVHHLVPKAQLATQRDDALAQTLHHLDQLEGANVRMGLVQNFGRGASLHQLGHDFAAQKLRVADLAPELAIGKRAGTTLAKLHIALRVQGVFAPQIPGVFGALAHHRAALQNNRPKTHLRQQQGGKHAARPKADHHRAQRHLGRRLRDHAVGHVGRSANMRMGSVARQCGVLRVTSELHIDDIDRHHVGFAGVKAAFKNLQLRDVLHRDTQNPRRRRPQRVQGMGRGQAVVVRFAGRVSGAPGANGQSREREFDFGNADHGARGYQANADDT